MWLLFLFLFIIGIILALLFFILGTEGRYFGKRFIRWLYNRRSVQYEVRDDWELWEHLIKRLKISPSEQLLDLGTQTGHLPRLVARQPDFKGRVVGIDWSADMIQEAQRQARLEETATRIQFLSRDVQQPLPFPDATFTLVTCVTGLLDGLRDPDTLFAEIRRVLQPGGRVVFRFEPRPLKATKIRHLDWFSKRLAKWGFSEPQTRPWTATHKLVISKLLHAQ